MSIISLGDQCIGSVPNDRAFAQIVLKTSVERAAKAASDPAVNTFDVTPLAMSSSVLT